MLDWFRRAPMLAGSVGARILISSTSLAWLPLLLPTLRVHLQVLDHLRCEGAVRGDPVARLALVFAGSCAGPDERIGAEVALDVGGDDLSRDAIAKHKPLIRSRHGD